MAYGVGTCTAATGETLNARGPGQQPVQGPRPDLGGWRDLESSW
jgi:hypothetical protein